ncbi:MAG: peptidoglycan-binding protein [Clostridia bacterium]|nr:peptidoglycan-binding protein [Clostridia bacterium]
MRIENQTESIRAVQNYLYEIGLTWDFLPTVYPDGIYGDNTKEAVSIFQREVGLPVTGEVDYLTWTELYQQYKDAIDLRTAKSSPPLTEGQFPLTIGARGYGVVQLKTALGALSLYYPALPALAPTSLYQYSTALAVQNLERIYRLQETGEVDLPLWNRLFADLESKQSSASDFRERKLPFPFRRGAKMP